MTESLITRVARAIFAVLHQQAAAHPSTNFDSEYANRRGDYMGVVVTSKVDRCVASATAAIEAMRHITPAMLDAAADTPGMKAASDAMAFYQIRGFTFADDAFTAGSPLEQVWTAMLTAALGEGA